MADLLPRVFANAVAVAVLLLGLGATPHPTPPMRNRSNNNGLTATPDHTPTALRGPGQPRR